MSEQDPHKAPTRPAIPRTDPTTDPPEPEHRTLGARDMNALFAALEGVKSHIDTRVDGLESNTANMEARLDGKINAQGETIHARLTRGEEAMQSMVRLHQTLHERQEEALRRQDETDRIVEELKRKASGTMHAVNEGGSQADLKLAQSLAAVIENQTELATAIKDERRARTEFEKRNNDQHDATAAKVDTVAAETRTQTTKIDTVVAESRAQTLSLAKLEGWARHPAVRAVAVVIGACAASYFGTSASHQNSQQDAMQRQQEAIQRLLEQAQAPAARSERRAGRDSGPDPSSY